MPKHHTPLRRCVGCGQVAPKNEMLRFRVAEDGRLVADPAGPGRGAYLHRSIACWERFAARKGVVPSLRRDVDRAARRRLVQSLKESAKQEKVKT